MQSSNDLFSKQKHRVTVHTDGSCDPNPGPGGWAAILECNGQVRELSGAETATTNNRMELMAAIKALAALTESCEVTMVTDSKYVQHAFTKGWLKSWQKNGWKTSNKEPVKNRELWEELVAQCERHTVHWQWQKGHIGHTQNERADTLANMARMAQ